MGVVYDSLLNESLDADAPDPFWALEEDTPKAKLDWIKEALDSSIASTHSRAQNQLTNLCLCKGIHWEAQDSNADFRSADRFRFVSDTSKMVVNDIHRFVDTTSAKLTRYTPAVKVSPDSNEFQDKQGSRAAQKAIDSHDNVIDASKVIREAARHAMMFGYQPVLTLWNPDAGALTPRYKAAKKKHGDQAMKYKKDGWVYNPDKPERIGEVEVVMPQPWELTFQPAPSPRQCEWVIWETSEHVAKLRKDHPKLASQIKCGENSEGVLALDVESLQVVNKKNHVTVRHMWHRSNKYLPGGKYIKALPQLILEEKENPFSGAEILEESEWGDLPVEWMQDVTFNGHFFGMSSLNFVKNLSHTRNQFLTMQKRNVLLHGHPKMLVHRRARVSTEDLGNDTTVVEYDGMVEPKLMTFATVAGDVMKLYEMLGGEQDKLMKLHPISSGEPPAGIKAGVALRLLEQIEDLLMTNQAEQMKSFVIALARKRLALMSIFYKKEHERFTRILGADNEDLVEALDVDALGKRHNVKLEHASAFAKNPAARAQQVIDLLEVRPDALTNEQVIDALELTRPEKITDPAVAAVSAAEYINELCAQDKELPKPRQGLHYLVAWPIHMAFYQRAGFTSLPKRAQERFLDYLLGLEFLMSEQANINPAFAARVFSMPGFPAFYNLPPQQIASIHGVTDQAMGPGQAKPQPGLPQQLTPPDQGLQPQAPLTNEQIAQG